MKYRCPVCRKVIDRALRKQGWREGFYPFCCNRCKLIDLGRWIDDEYKIITKFKGSQKDGENAGQAGGDGE